MSDYKKKIAARLAVIPPYVPTRRPVREEWVCPTCGLTGEHMRVKVSENRCKGCCKTDAAEDLYQALKGIMECPTCLQGGPCIDHDGAAQDAIEKAEGRS